MAAAAGMGDGSCGTGTSWMCIGGICWNPAVTFCCRKIIKKLYSFHQRLLWQKQNEINGANAEMLVSVKDYIIGQSNRKIEELENKCHEYELRISQLEELVKK